MIWFTKQYTSEYPIVYPPARIDDEMYVEVLQRESMSGLYPESAFLCEYDLIDYKGSIVIPWKSGKTCCGFMLHKTKRDALDYIKANASVFSKLFNQFPEYFI